MTRQTMTVEDRARFLLEAAEDRVRAAEELLARRAKAIARRGEEWKARVEAGVPIHEHASILVFLESDVAEFRRAQAELERERAAVAVLKEIVGR
jgi:hypothetical protein